MAAITTRETASTGVTVAGVPLTNAQLDTNFINLNTELGEKLPLSGGTLTGTLIFGNSTSPNTNTIQFGDNTGWVLRYMTNVSGTPTERFRFVDSGDFNAVGAITQNGNQVLHAANYNSYALPLSGGTLTGKVILGAAGTAGDPALRLNLSNSGSFVHAQEIIASSLAADQTVVNIIGYSSSTKNSGYIGYKYSGTSESNSNLLTFGHWGSDHLVTIDGVGNTAIKGTLTLTASGDAQLYLNGNSTTWAGISWTDADGTDYTWYRGSTGTFSIGGGGSAVSGKKLHINGGTSIGANTVSSAAPTNGLLVESSTRLGSSFNASPASTAFSHTIAGIGSPRVVNFDGAGNLPSVWWTNGTRAYGAIDAIDPGLAFWANNGDTWQQQMYLGFGAITVNTTQVIQGNVSAWDATTPGLGVGGLHLGAASSTANAGSAITFGGRDASSGTNAQAGIFVHSDGNYGTKMYIATTNSYATGAQTAISIDHVGNVNFVRANPTSQGNAILNASNYTSYVAPAGGSWYGSGLPGSRWYGWTVDGGEIVMGQNLPNTGQMGFLIDGCYIAGENNGFWSLGGDNTWGSRRGMYWDGSYLNFTTNTPTARFENLRIDGGVAGLSNSSSYTEAAIEIREREFGGAQDDTWATAPRLSFHWGGRVASQIGMASNGRISILNNPGNDYESFQAAAIYGSIFYDSADTSYYLDPANSSTSLSIAGTIEQGNNYAHPNVEWAASGDSTGMVIFYLPGTTANYGMIHMVFDIYEYNGNATSTVTIGGHNWQSGWYNTGCDVVGWTPHQVRLGVKDGRFVVVFGGSGTLWHYGTVRLRKIHNASYYNNLMDLGGNWSAVQTTTESFTSVTVDLRQLRTPASFTAASILNQGALGTNSANARNHFTAYNAGNATATTGWIAAAFGDNNGSRTVIGSAQGNAHIGAHNADLTQWAPLFIGTDTANSTVMIGYDWGTAADTTYRLKVNGAFAATTKSFLIDHPTKPGKQLRYGSLEGPENGVYVRGKLKDNNVIELPEYWTKLVDPDSITVQLTPIGKHQKLFVSEIKDNKVYVESDSLFGGEVYCFYYVLAERVDVDKLEVEVDL